MAVIGLIIRAVTVGIVRLSARMAARYCSLLTPFSPLEPDAICGIQWL
ncbi:hypothetical protein Z949_3718 [Sulfitobacter guttiformis KCTC 32187]|nr:hypothetical protein Z949_3718 [Sulfitobacter guttiformis KCTC 32187]